MLNSANEAFRRCSMLFDFWSSLCSFLFVVSYYYLLFAPVNSFTIHQTVDILLSWARLGGEREKGSGYTMEEWDGKWREVTRGARDDEEDMLIAKTNKTIIKIQQGEERKWRKREEEERIFSVFYFISRDLIRLTGFEEEGKQRESSPVHEMNE